MCLCGFLFVRIGSLKHFLGYDIFFFNISIEVLYLIPKMFRFRLILCKYPSLSRKLIKMQWGKSTNIRFRFIPLTSISMGAVAKGLLGGRMLNTFRLCICHERPAPHTIAWTPSEYLSWLPPYFTHKNPIEPNEYYYIICVFVCILIITNITHFLSGWFGVYFSQFFLSINYVLHLQ